MVTYMKGITVIRIFLNFSLECVYNRNTMVSKSDLAYPDTWYSCFFGYVLYFERNAMRKLALSDEILMVKNGKDIN